MEKNEELKIEDNNGNVTEYEVLLAFYWYKTKKYYIVYTDNLETDGALNVYASIYYPNDKTTFYADVQFGSSVVDDNYPTLFDAGEMFWLRKVGYYVWRLSLGAVAKSTSGLNAWRGHNKQWLKDATWHISTIDETTHRTENMSTAGEFQTQLPMII